MSIILYAEKSFDVAPCVTMNFVPLENGANFAGKTLVLPTVSVGSVPQLSVELLVNAPQYKFQRVAFLDASDCVPFVSPPEPSSIAAFNTALEGTLRLTSISRTIRYCSCSAKESCY